MLRVLHTKKILEFFDPVDVPFVVAAKKQDTDSALDVDKIRIQLALSNGVQVLPCVAPEKESVKGVLLSLLFEVMNSLDE